MQLAQVRHPRVGREVRLEVRQPLQRPPARRRSGRARRARRPSTGSAASPACERRASRRPPAEVVAREREAAEGDERVGVARLARQHAAQQRLGALVEARRRRSRARAGGTRPPARRAGRRRRARGAPRPAAARSRPSVPPDAGRTRPRSGADAGTDGVAPPSDSTSSAARKAAPDGEREAAKRGVQARVMAVLRGGASAGPRSVRPRLVPVGSGRRLRHRRVRRLRPLGQSPVNPSVGSAT